MLGLLIDLIDNYIQLAENSFNNIYGDFKQKQDKYIEYSYRYQLTAEITADLTAETADLTADLTALWYLSHSFIS